MAIKAGQLKERTDYQAYILEMLREENGYQVRPSAAYDPGYGMDVELLFSFLQATHVFCQVLFPEKSVGIPFFQQGIFPAFSGHYASLRMRACSIR